MTKLLHPDWSRRSAINLLIICPTVIRLKYCNLIGLEGCDLNINPGKRVQLITYY